MSMALKKRNLFLKLAMYLNVQTLMIGLLDTYLAEERDQLLCVHTLIKFLLDIAIIPISGVPAFKFTI